jgi:signal transduction histidine kinase/CheY-like chemotaxis protein
MRTSQQRQLDFARADAREIPRDVRRRLAFFETCTRLVVGDGDEARVVQTVARAALPELGSYGFIDLKRGGGRMERFAFRTSDAGLEIEPVAPPVTWSTGLHPLLDVIRGGAGRRISPVDDRERTRLLDAEGTAGALHDSKLSSLVVVPVGQGDRVLGTLTVCYASGEREHEAADLTLAEDLARLAAFAIENVDLRHQAHARACELVEERARQEAGCRNFLSTLSHELRASLAAMLLWEKILRGASDETTRNRALDAIHQSTVAQSKMVEEITDLSRCVNGNLEIERSIVALDRVIEAAVKGAMPGATDKGVALMAEPTGTLGSVRGDATRLRQALDILLSHALISTSSGGRIRVSGVRGEARVQIIVADTGSGIAAARLPHVFAPFAATVEPGLQAPVGLGLGLAVVSRLVALHGGTVAAASDGEGRGSTFTITLPLADAAVVPVFNTTESTAAAPALERGRRAPARTGRMLKGLRVLVVDDEPRVREAITLVLRDAGSKVTTASSAAEAFAALRDGRWDAVVSDIGMPEEDGYSLIQRVRGLPVEGGRGVGAVALTGCARPQDQSRALEAGFNLHLTKPVEATDLIRAVATVAARPRTPASSPARVANLSRS